MFFFERHIVIFLKMGNVLLMFFFFCLMTVLLEFKCLWMPNTAFFDERWKKVDHIFRILWIRFLCIYFVFTSFHVFIHCFTCRKRNFCFPCFSSIFNLPPSNQISLSLKTPSFFYPTTCSYIQKKKKRLEIKN
jgi:hypothetical protein